MGSLKNSGKVYMHSGMVLSRPIKKGASRLPNKMLLLTDYESSRANSASAAAITSLISSSAVWRGMTIIILPSSSEFELFSIS